ncbi:hypothetical protein ACUNV4_18025 [Granulosicoccus sp. 3-233]|uniref:hypothetical protein n=1 Tax=Granulosicoccus sp. 3-233 TaxID=3417969 RepID=UPI003D331D8B
MGRIGILAYGSLIEDPGIELGPLIVNRVVDVKTPFNIEFARSSRTRDGAPTVVPVVGFGAAVMGVVLVLDESIDIELARDLLWRRETRSEGSNRHYRHAKRPVSNQIVVAQVEDFHNVDTVLYTSITSNIPNPTPPILARLAINSAAGYAGSMGRDGISYLISLKRQLIETPLMTDYEAEILKLLGASSLRGALQHVREIATTGQAPPTIF